jgi:hypothetical protein
MIKINANLDAEMVIGDTGPFSITPRIDSKPILEEGDIVYFTVRKLKEKSIVLQKVITEFENGTCTITINPEDTTNLEEGNYIYDLKLVRSDGTVDTLIPNRPYAYFSLKKGVK